jgi:hypothetical protein
MKDNEAADFMDGVKQIARGLEGHFMFYDPGRPSYSLIGECYGIVAQGDEADGEVHGWGLDQRQSVERLAKLRLLLERSSNFDAAEPYLVVVSDWPERAEEAARWIVSNGDGAPRMFVNWSPSWVDDQFDGERHFSVGGDGDHRVAGMAKLYNLLNRKH